MPRHVRQSVLARLPGDLWREASPSTLRAVLPLLAVSALVVAGVAAVVVPVSGAASPDYAKFSLPLKIPPVRRRYRTAMPTDRLNTHQTRNRSMARTDDAWCSARLRAIAVLPPP